MFGRLTNFGCITECVVGCYALSKSLKKRYVRFYVIVGNMSADVDSKSVVTVPSGVGGAVGVPEAHWFVAVVKNNTEKSVFEKLNKLGHKCYVPLQEEFRIWKNGKRAVVKHVVIPSMVFINCTESVRRSIVSLPYIIRFMTNRACSSLNGSAKPLAIIPDKQMKQLMFMVGNSDSPISFSNIPYKQGDMVRVIRGKLAGLEGVVKTVDDRHSEVIVNLDFLGNARLTIETIDIERINKP